MPAAKRSPHRSPVRPQAPPAAPGWGAPRRLPMNQAGAMLTGLAGLLLACGGEPVGPDPGAPLATAPHALTATTASPFHGLLAPLPADLASAFDPNPAPSDSYRVVGRLTPPSFSWGEIELLEGSQRVRSEGYNRRTEKLRERDTFQSDKYPLRVYFGALNQQIVDGFNLYYSHACGRGPAACPTSAPGPTRPEARFVLLHKGPKTAARSCRTDLTPMLLVHGAMQDANVWLFPGGNDGSGAAFPGTTQKTGLVQHLEAAGRCVYAVTFGNFHGDNYSQAIGVANAIARIRALHKRSDGSLPKVDVTAWSKGVLAVDAYLANAPAWPAAGSRYFDRLATAQSAAVPAYRDDVRVYTALSGPHKGLDLNFRHPIHTLTIASTSNNAPVGRGPMPWTWFSAMQCVTFGPDSPWYENPYAKSVCEGRGGTWPDFFTRIYLSNLSGLDSSGKPVARDTLKRLNTTEGVSASAFEFDEYNISLFGSIDESGRYVNAYLGQLQAAYDLRASYPIPRRDSSEWKDLDPDENRYYPWLRPKLTFLGGGYLDDPDRTACRKTAFLPAASPCIGWHTYYNSRNAEPGSGFYSKYQLMSGLGIAVAEELGGHFITRLAARGLDSRLGALYVLYGSSLGAPGTGYETDGLATPTSPPNSDGVLFKESIAALTQLTQGWSSSKRSTSTKQESMPLGHLEIGVTPAAWDKLLTFLKARD